MEKDSKIFYDIETNKPVLESSPIDKSLEHYSLSEIFELLRRLRLVANGDFSEIAGLDTNSPWHVIEQVIERYLKPKAGFLDGK